MILKWEPERAISVGENALNRNVYSSKAFPLIAQGARALDLNETESYCLELICGKYLVNIKKKIVFVNRLQSRD
ncbi:MAG TPA: hypothetical protein DCS60_02440 [Opitutae bacterium]|nr:hypothetical protein [Opitutae bacterium]